MAAISRIDYKQALQVAGVAVAFGVMEPTDSLSKIGALALGCIVCKGTDVAYRYAKKGYDIYQLFTHDLPKLEECNKFIKENSDIFAGLKWTVSGYSAPDNKALIESIQERLPLQNTVDLTTSKVICLEIPEILSEILKNLPIQDIRQFGLASRYCYLFSKDTHVWQDQLKKLSPNSGPLSATVTPELQCKMFYKRFYGPLLDAQKKYEENTREAVQLRESIDKEQSQDGTSKEYHALQNKLYCLVGSHYNLVGSGHNEADDFIHPNSRQGLVLQEISDLKEEFNSQDKLDTFLSTVIEYQQLEHHLPLAVKTMDKLLKKVEENEVEENSKKLLKVVKEQVNRVRQFWQLNNIPNEIVLPLNDAPNEIDATIATLEGRISQLEHLRTKRPPHSA
jgi:hypothetical protein